MLDCDEDHFVGKIALKALIIKGDSVLIVRHVGSESTWELPGGRLNKDEDLKTGLQREIHEELGVEIIVGDAISVETFLMKPTSEQHVAIVYKAHLLNVEAPFAVATDEVAEVVWVDHDSWKNYSLFGNYERVVENYFGAIK